MVRIEKSSHLTDYKQLAELIHEILIEIYGQSPWSRSQIVLDLEKPEVTYYLAYSEEGHDLLGFLASQMIIDEIEITNLAVKADFQKQGIASLLMESLFPFIGSIFLEVRASNIAAIKLYEKFGFSKFNERKDYYHNPVENALLMKKESI